MFDGQRMLINAAHITRVRCLCVCRQHAYEVAVEIKDSREAKVAFSSAAGRVGIWANLNPKGGRYDVATAMVHLLPLSSAALCAL